MDCRSAKKKIEKTGDVAADRKSEDRDKCYVCGSEEDIAHKHCGLCKAWSTGFAIVVSEELRRVQCWPKYMYHRVLR